MKKVSFLMLLFFLLSKINADAQNGKLLSLSLNQFSSLGSTSKANVGRSITSGRELGISHASFKNDKISFSEINYGLKTESYSPNNYLDYQYLNIRGTTGKFIKIEGVNADKNIMIGFSTGLLFDIYKPTLVSSNNNVESIKGSFGDIFNVGLAFNFPLFIDLTQNLGVLIGYKSDLDFYQFGKTQFLNRKMGFKNGIYFGSTIRL